MFLISDTTRSSKLLIQILNFCSVRNFGLRRSSLVEVELQQQGELGVLAVIIRSSFYLQ